MWVLPRSEPSGEGEQALHPTISETPETEAYESYIQALRLRLKKQGIKTAVFNIKPPHRFVACMWTSGQRRKLARRAADFDGVLVLGCDGAIQTVRDSLGSSDCRVIPAMEVEGLMNIVPKVSFPFDVSLEMRGVIPVEMQSGPSRSRSAVVG